MKTYLNIEQPIIFSTEMVKAIIDKKKTVTRRIVKPQPAGFMDYFVYFHSENKNYRSSFGAYMQAVFGEPCSYPRIKAKYAIGDRLWVRETFLRMKRPKNCPFLPSGGEIGWWTKGDSDYCYKASIEHYQDDKWSSPLFLPRIASRFLLEVTGVRIERLHELDDTEALLEGFENRDDFKKFWDLKNVKRGFPWAANPWVYRIQFKELKNDNSNA